MNLRNSIIVSLALAAMLTLGASSASAAPPYGFNDSFSAPSSELVLADNVLKTSEVALAHAQSARTQAANRKTQAEAARDQAEADYQAAQAHSQAVHHPDSNSTQEEKDAADEAEQDALDAYNQSVALVAQRQSELDSADANVAQKQAKFAQAQSDYQEAFNAHKTKLIVALNQAAAAGAKVNRLTIDWSQINVGFGGYDFRFAELAYDLMRARGIKPLILITGSPCWAHLDLGCNPTFTQGGKQVPYRAVAPSKEAMPAWRDLNREVAEQFPKAVGIEVWNEPNLKIYWGPNPKGVAYKKLFFQAAKGVAKADRKMKMVFAGLSPERTIPGMNWDRFMEGAYRSGIGKKADALGMHPYSRKGESTEKQIKIASKLRRKYDRRSRLWVTEYGSSSSKSRKSQRKQAKSLVKSLGYFKKKRVSLTLIHRLRYAPNPNPWERGLSVISSNGKVKPAYCALAKAHKKRPAVCR